MDIICAKDCENYLQQYIKDSQEVGDIHMLTDCKMPRWCFMELLDFLIKQPDNMRWHHLTTLMPMIVHARDAVLDINWINMLWIHFNFQLKTKSYSGFERFQKELQKYDIQIPQGMELCKVPPRRKLINQQVIEEREIFLEKK